MRSLQLETALRNFVEEAADYLQAEVAAGAEVPFEVAAQGGRGQQPQLYCYRPLTTAFIEERVSGIKALAAYGPAVSLLTGFDGLDRYVSARDAGAARADRRARAGVAARALLAEVFDQQTSFELQPERLETALLGLEDSASADAHELTLLATLHGLTVASPELALAPGLLVAQPEALGGAPAGALHPSESHGGEHLLVVFTAESDHGLERSPDAGEDGALAEGREVMGELLRALRLFGDGRVTLGALAWTRAGGGPWNQLALGGGGRPHGMLVVGVDQEDELRAFCNLVSRRRPRDNEVAWALERFELGCERSHEYEALSDYLLALRALLEPEGSASGMLPGRLAALCATPEGRGELAARVLKATALERAVIAGTAVEHAGGQALVRDLADHLRALLRDVICGHLDSDLVAVADELLLVDDTEPVQGPAGQEDPWETDQLNLAGLPG